MRVIERIPQTNTPSYLIARVVGVTAGIFALLSCVLILMNNNMLRSSDPMNNAVLEEMKASLTPSTDDPALIEKIRELDRLSRQAYFEGENFNQQGILFMVLCLVVMVASLKYAGNLSKEDAYPDPNRPKRDLVEEARVARNTFAGGTLMVFGFLLVTAILWESPLDVANSQDATAQGSGTDGAGSLAGATPEPEPVAAALPVLAVPTAEQLRRNWPSFLGAANSVAAGSELPHDWEAEGAIQWKSQIPLPGFSSPIVWEDKVFLTGGSEKSREVYCFDATSGALLWSYVVSDLPDAPKTLPKVTGDTGFAAATMATEGNYVFAIFATGALVALDLEGNLIWSRQFGVPDNPYGHASSLALSGPALFVQYDQRSDAGFYALDLRDGSELWKVQREHGASWSSPLIIEHEGQEQVVLAAEGALIGYDTKDGKELWNVDCLHGAEVACTPTYADGFVYMAADYAAVIAVDLSTKEIAWEYSDLTPGVSSPIIVSEHLVAGLSEGGIVCLNAKTGEEAYFEITDDGFYSSPVLVGDNLYLLNRVGGMHIFKPGPTFSAVANPVLPEEANCTPAFVEGALFLRGPENLYRIGS